MKKRNSDPEDAARLRQKAEVKLNARKSQASKTVSEADKLKLIHELEVHQIELEMQNEELVKAKFKAEQAEEKYADLYDFAPSGYLSLTKEGEILNLNFAEAKMLGKERSRLINSRFSFFLSESTRPVFNQFLEKAFTTKEKQSCEVIIETQNNSTDEEHSLPIYVTIDGLVNQHGKICHLTVVDISARRQAEIAIIESEKMLSKIAENFPNSYLSVVNRDFTIGLTSGQELKKQNLDPKQFEGLKLEQIFGDKTEFIRDKYKKTFLGKEQSFEMFFNNQYQLYSTVPLFAEDGSVPRILSVAENITKRRQAEDELIAAKKNAEESEERFNLAMQASNDGLFDWNIETNEIYYSPAWKKMLGYEEDELPNDFTVWETTTDPQDVKKSWELQQKLITKQIDRFVAEFKMKHKDGHWIDVLSRAEAVFNNNGKAVRMVGTHTDITKHKQEEQELLKAKEKAEESDRLKSAFLANMSHEIRTPMNGILGFADLLKAPNLTGEEQQKYLGIIEKSGERMLNIINNIVDISKIEAGLMDIVLKETNINEQIEYIFTFFKPEAEAKGIKFTFKNHLPAHQATIKTDREKLYAILTNLVKNALKHIEKGAIEFGYMLKAGNEISELEFYVKDTGIGIPQNRQEAIFERFIQADIADKMARQGAGLGLSISKAYVEMLGGKIWVESVEGEGAVFYFTLPYSTQTTKTDLSTNHQSSESKEKPVSRVKILIVEDDDVSAELLEILLKDVTKTIIHANSGEQAIELCKINQDIDVILMDIKMQGINGLEATKRIREFNKEVMIIAQTAYALSGDKERVFEAGCNDYITKPIDKKEILEKIKNVLPQI